MIPTDKAPRALLEDIERRYRAQRAKDERVRAMLHSSRPAFR